MRLSYAVSLQKTGFESVGQGDWKTIAQHMGQIGFDGIELAIKDPLKVNVPELEEVLSRTGMRIAAIGTGQAYFDDGLSLIADDMQIRDQTVKLLKNHIDLAEKFGALVIIGLIRGKLKEQRDRAKAYSFFVDNMIELDDYARQKGVNMAVEPVNRYETDYLNTVADTVELIEANKLKHTGILLDTFHMNIEEAVWQSSVSMSAKYLKHVHIADSNRFYPSRGHLNFKEIVSMIQDTGYNNYFSGEMLPEPDLKTSVEGYYKYMRSLQ